MNAMPGDYTYRCKGTPFTRQETNTPAVYAKSRRRDGTPYIRRLRVSEVRRISAREVVKELETGLNLELRHAAFGGARTLSESFAAAFNPKTTPSTLTVGSLRGCVEAEGTTVRLRVTIANFGGVRWWLECPWCNRFKDNIFGVALSHGHIVGCRACLGLTHSSRSRHKCPEQDGAVLSFGSRSARVHSSGTQERALKRLDRRIGGLMQKAH